MPSTVESLDARALELGRQLRDLLADTPVGRTIRLPQIGLTMEVVAVEGDSVRVTVASGEAIIQRPEAKPAPLPDYSGIPEIDMEEFARGAGKYTPPQVILDEDWSDHAPKKDG